MLRFLALLLAFILIVPLLRAALGFLGRLFTNFAIGDQTARQGPRQPKAVGGVLRKDPVCGTYVSESLALKMSESGQTYYFCSAECRDKFKLGQPGV